MQTLIDLFDLEIVSGESRDGVLWRDLAIRRKGGTAETRAIAAYEKGGKLFWLASPNHRDEVRALIALKKESSALNGLRPQMTAVAKRHDFIDRLKVVGIDVMRLREDSSPVDTWFARGPKLPGQHSVAPAEAPKSFQPFPGAGGDGPPLMVCLGSDPSATLVALFSHRPNTAVVFYDDKTPQVLSAAARLVAEAKDLPVGEIVLWPASVSGVRIPAASDHQFRCKLGHPFRSQLDQAFRCKLGHRF